ncbi:MAG TPA: hypothetical protein VG938_12090 [Verrucomicrobiae bacterium]|jgi:hypothetical protein|nr:hypothetical protein [Verrucomicrobiae bacterium]
MRPNLPRRRVLLGLAIIVLAAGILSGFASSDRSALGRLQVGHAGPVCSFFTTIFDGPDVGRGRNEGHAKSLGEIQSLFGPFGIKARREAWQLAASGLGLEEYQSITYDPGAHNLYQDTFVTVKAVRDRQLVDSKDVQDYYRRCFSGNYLNTDVLITSLEQGGIGHEEVRNQFWRWVGYTYDGYEMDYYLFNGNQNMIRKLYTSGIITKKEAVYLLTRWFLARTAYEPSMLDDLEYFGITSPEDAKLLTTLELAYLDYFKIAPADRSKLLERHRILYNAVRAQLAWPITIPLLSKIKARAPSLSDRYADAYNPKQYIAVEPLPAARPIGKYKGYDARISVSLNDGRKLSTTERLSRWYLGNILSAFNAASGETQTAYEFNRRLYSPACKAGVDTVVAASKRGIITADQCAQYLKTCVQDGYCSHSIYVAVQKYNEPILPELARHRMFFNRCFLDGISYDDYHFMTTLAGGSYSATISDILRSRIAHYETSADAVSILCDEKIGGISRRESDALLVAHFYTLLAQISDHSWEPTKLEHGWRMRAQRSEVERAVYDYKADKATQEVENIRALHE